jgi:DNA-binding response OmpR family regulator
MEIPTKPRVLVVDDEPLVLRSIANALSESFLVDTALSGGLALRQLESATYDAIVIDVNMPGLTGPELFASIRSTHPELANRVVMTAGDAFHPDTQEFLEKTGLACVPKPFSPKELRVALEAVLRFQSGA